MRVRREFLLWILILLVAASSGGCGSGGIEDVSSAPPPGFDPDAGPYLARGTWDYSGSGKSEAKGITCDTYVTEGVSTIESDGEAGNETTTNVTNSATIEIDCDLLGSRRETLSGSTSVRENVTDNYLKIEQQDLTFEYFLMSDREAQAHLYGTREIRGIPVKVNLWLSCIKRSE